MLKYKSIKYEIDSKRSQTKSERKKERSMK